MDRITNANAPAPEYAEYTVQQEPQADPAYDDEGEPTKLYPFNDSAINGPADDSFGDNDAEESTSPRPKFDFDDLKFGSNFDNK